LRNVGRLTTGEDQAQWIARRIQPMHGSL
jgi:hypothetical protein